MEEKYKSDAEKVLKEISKNLKEIPEATVVTGYYKFRDVLRNDASPVKKDLYKEVLKMAPKRDKSGYYITERLKL